MTEPDRALAPLNAVSAAIDNLETYRTPQELAESLQAIGQAVERSLRQLLRADTASPDELRLAALSPEDLPADTLYAALRDHHIVSAELARMVTELKHATSRAAASNVRAADADHARDTVRVLRDEIAIRSTRDRSVPSAAPVTHAAPPIPTVPAEHAPFAGPSVVVAPPPSPSPSPTSPSRAFLEDDAAEPAKRGRAKSVLIPIAVAAGLLCIAWLVFRIAFAGPTAMESGIEAFADKRWGIAEQNFRVEMGENPENVTARLYLGRVLRVQGRAREAAQVLNDARKRAPGDADVLREYGHALMDMKQPALAVAAYRQAQEIAPAQASNWVGLVRALRASRDPSAEEVLQRAPAEAQAALRGQQ